MALHFKGILDWVEENLLLVLTLGGVAFGAILGFSLKSSEPSPETQLLLAYPGEIFVRALQLMILPCVVFSLFVGAASLDVKANSKIVLVTFTFFILTSFYNSVVGVILAAVIHPGDPRIRELTQNDTTGESVKASSLMDNFLDLGRNLVPNNIFTAFFQQTTTQILVQDDKVMRSVVTRNGSNTLGVIAFTLAFGAVMSTLKEKATIMNGAIVMEACIIKAVTGIIWLTPVGVGSIVCAKILEVKEMGALMSQLGLFITTVAIGLAAYQFFVVQLIYFIFLRKNPFKFYLGILPALLTGFSADSSAAAMPVTLKCLDDNVKIDPKISHFVVPIGVTVNMDGTALFLSVASVFMAQMYSIELGFGDYLTICVTATAVSIAVATAPSASLTMLYIILNAINVPAQDVGLLFAIDWLVDRLRTTNNVLSDCYAAAIVENFAKSAEIDGNKGPVEKNSDDPDP